jgi:hypothetical protein
VGADTVFTTFCCVVLQQKARILKADRQTVNSKLLLL